MQFIPLINIFGYESSVVSSILVFYFTGLIILSDKKSLTIKTIVISRYKQLATLFFLPLFTFIISGLFNGFCSITDGFSYYFVIVFPSFILSLSVAYTILLLFQKFRKAIFTFILVLLFTPILFELYSYPQISFYNSLIGYFPGTIYDEEISITNTFILYRLYILFFSTYLFGLSQLYFKKKLIKSVFVGLIVVSSILAVYIKPVFGFATDEHRTQKELSIIRNTKNFSIYFSDKTSKRYIEHITLLHEYYFENLQTILEFKPKKRIKSFIYNDEFQKEELFGSKVADVSKPWLYQIYLDKQNLEFNLLHELVHSFSAEFGVTPLKLAKNLNAALVEGFAMAIEDSLSDNNIHYQAFHALKLIPNLKAKDLFETQSFFTSYSSVSYIVSGSFIKFLISKYGIKSVINLYQTMDFKLSFGKDTSSLEAEYLRMLKNHNFEFNKSKAEFYFGYKPFIKKNCPRLEAKTINLGNSLLLKKDEKAKMVFLNLYKQTNSPKAFFGYMASLIQMKKYQVALRFLNHEIDKFNETGSYYRLFFLQAQLNLKLGNFKKAKIMLKKIIEMDLNDNYNLNAIGLIELIDFNQNIAKDYMFSEKNQFDFTQLKDSPKLQLYFFEVKHMDYKAALNSIKDIKFESYENPSFLSFSIFEKYYEMRNYIIARDFLLLSIKMNKSLSNQCLLNNQLKKTNWFINYLN